MLPTEVDRIIKPLEMGLVADEEGNLRLVIPNRETDDSSYPPIMQLLSAAYVRARDPVWVEEMLLWFTTT